MNYHSKNFVLFLYIFIAFTAFTVVFGLNDNVVEYHILSRNSNISSNSSSSSRNISTLVNNVKLCNENFYHQDKVTSCHIPNQPESDGICIKFTECEAFKKLKNSPDIKRPEVISFLKRVQCSKTNFSATLLKLRSKKLLKHNESEMCICCPRNCSDYSKPMLMVTTIPKISKISKVLVANPYDEIEKWKKRNRISMQNIKTIGREMKSHESNVRNECGKQITNRIYGGEVTELDEFPWMALIMYNSNEFGCSAVLINKRYLLTAAHCVQGSIVREKKGLKLIRLGEYNTRTQPDCIEESNYLNCADVSIDMGIDKIIVHPLYDEFSAEKFNDIALIRLKNTVPLTRFIMPICLPDPIEKKTPPFKEGTKFYVAGWGRTDLFNDYFPNIRSPIKLKLAVPIVSKENCTKIFEKYGFHLAPTQICAGGEESKDTCSGDSGGPLMYYDRNSSRWITYGIVSYGFAECGALNRPAVYTNVAAYVKWIIESMQF